MEIIRAANSQTETRMKNFPVKHASFSIFLATEAQNFALQRINKPFGKQSQIVVNKFQ